MSDKLQQIAEFLKKQDFNYKIVNHRFIVTRIATDGPSFEQIIEYSEVPGRIAIHTIVHGNLRPQEIPAVLELAARFPKFTRFGRAQVDPDECTLTVEVYMLTAGGQFNKRQFFELQTESEAGASFLHEALTYVLREGVSPEQALEKAFDAREERGDEGGQKAA